MKSNAALLFIIVVSIYVLVSNLQSGVQCDICFRRSPPLVHGIGALRVLFGIDKLETPEGFIEVGRKHHICDECEERRHDVH